MEKKRNIFKGRKCPLIYQDKTQGKILIVITDWALWVSFDIGYDRTFEWVLSWSISFSPMDLAHHLKACLGAVPLVRHQLFPLLAHVLPNILAIFETCIFSPLIFAYVLKLEPEVRWSGQFSPTIQRDLFNCMQLLLLISYLFNYMVDVLDVF